MKSTKNINSCSVCNEYPAIFKLIPFKKDDGDNLCLEHYAKRLKKQNEMVFDCYEYILAIEVFALKRSNARAELDALNLVLDINSLRLEDLEKISETEQRDLKSQIDKYSMVYDKGCN